MIIQATTPTISIKVEDANLSEYEEIVLVMNNGTVQIKKKKSKDDMVISDDESTLSVTLSQEETKILKTVYPLLIQLRVKDSAGNVSASDVIEMKVEKSLSLEVL